MFESRHGGTSYAAAEKRRANARRGAFLLQPFLCAGKEKWKGGAGAEAPAVLKLINKLRDCFTPSK